VRRGLSPYSGLLTSAVAHHSRPIARAVFLVIEEENPEGLSTRKLVLETAKHNVLTAHSGAEGLEIFARHPVDAVVVHSAIKDVPCNQIVERIKEEKPQMKVILLAPSPAYRCSGADLTLPSHEPDKLLHALQDIVANEHGKREAS
jgi:DNA-binding NtrC family response regulator